MAFHHKVKNFVKATAGARLVSFFDFDIYSPYNRGPNQFKTSHAIKAATSIFPLLNDLSKSLGSEDLPLIPAESFRAQSENGCDALKALLDSYGSDKANKHNYHLLLGAILSPPQRIRAVLEIGLGTNNPDVASNMTKAGKPGASVRAFRDYLPNAQIYGADFDKRILFAEDRIQTFFVDQTDPATFAALGRQVPAEFDLIIDDGLHSPTANIASLTFGLGRLAVGGWMVIEDVNPDAAPIWQLVARLLPATFKPMLVSCTKNPVFAVQRLV